MSRIATEGVKPSLQEKKANSSNQWLPQNDDSVCFNEPVLLTPERATRVHTIRRENDDLLRCLLLPSGIDRSVLSVSSSQIRKPNENNHPDTKLKLALFSYQCVKGRRNYLVRFLDAETLEFVETTRKLPFTISEGMAVCQFDEKVYFVGGRNPNGGIQSWCVECNTKTDFSYFLQDFPSTIECAGAVANKENLYVVGGKNSHGKRVNWVYCYNLSHNKWQKMPSMHYSRSNASVAFLNDCLYVVGITEKPTYCTEQWQISSDQTWTVICLPSFISVLTCKIFVCLDEVYMFARGKGARIYQYDSFRKNWKGKEDLNGPPCISHIVSHNSSERKMSQAYVITDDFPDYKWRADTWEWEKTEGMDKFSCLSWLYCHLIY